MSIYHYNQVGQFLMSTETEVHNDSAPGMTIIPPLNQWSSDYTMVTMQTWNTLKVGFNIIIVYSGSL